MNRDSGAGNLAGTLGGQTPPADGGGQTPPADGGGQTPPGNSTPPSWLDGLSDDDKGYAQTKGFKDPSAVLGSYRNLEKMMGNKENLMQRPKQDDKEAMMKHYDEMGRPKESKDYPLALKNADPSKEGEAPDIVFLKETFHKIGITDSQARDFNEDYNKFVADSVAKDELKAKEKSEAEIGELRRHWGSEFDKNVAVGQKAVSALSMKQETVDAMAKSMGHKDLAILLEKVGSSLGEHVFVGAGEKQTGVMTPETAKMELDILKKDKGFQKLMMNKDVEAKRKWNLLHERAFPGVTTFK